MDNDGPSFVYIFDTLCSDVLEVGGMFHTSCTLSSRCSGKRNGEILVTPQNSNKKSGRNKVRVISKFFFYKSLIGEVKQGVGFEIIKLKKRGR